MAITKNQKIIAAVFCFALAFYTLLGFYILPTLLRTKLPAIILENTGWQAQLSQVSFNPYSMELAITGFSMAETEGQPLSSFEKLAVNVGVLASIRHLALVVEDITLLKPSAYVHRHANGSFNFTSMPVKHSPQPESQGGTKLPAFLVGRLSIENGEAHWQDSQSGTSRRESILPINLSVSHLSTLDETKAGVDFSLQIASGGRLQWQGELSLIPLESKGHLQLESLDLAKIWQLLGQESLPLEISDGHVNIQADYQAAVLENILNAKVEHGEIAIKQLKIVEKSRGEALIDLPVTVLTGISADLKQKQLTIAQLSSNDAAIKAWRQADGLINYQALFPSPDATTEPAATPAAPVKSQPDWHICLDELLLKNYQIQFSDQSQKIPPVLQLSAINFNLRKFGNAQAEPLPMQFSAVFNQQGNLKVNGNISLKPMTADLTLDINGIHLKDFQSYLDNYLNLELVNGSFNSHGNLQVKQADNLQLVFHGDADIADLLTRDKVVNKDFLKWADLQLQQIDIDLAQQSFNLAKVLFDRPYLRFIIQKDHRTNLADIIPTKTTSKTAPAEVPAPAPVTPEKNPLFSIGSVEVKDGRSDFADYSLILPFIAEMNALNGAVDGFTSQQNAKLKLLLRGKVYDIAQVNIKGFYQLNTANSDITLNFSHMPLPLITPYMADFAGYKIEKGQMALDLSYKVDHGNLTAQNKIFIDQLTLGEQVENPHASSLPLRLAIALLKDADGKINLDFPVTGSLDDPQFSVGALIVDVVGNLITKLVSSPFQAFGDLLSDEHDYSAVKFTAGSAELDSQETAKLDQLGKALQSKPGLTLEVKGKAYQVLDWPQMRFDALTDILKKMKSGELRDAGKKIRSEYIELSEDEYKRLLEKFFKEVFPADIDYSLLGRPRIKSQPDAEFYTVARQKLEAVMLPDAQKLNDLAIARANAISKYMIEKSQVDINRIYILSPELEQANAADITSVLSLNAAQ